jgi:hypothetical protein
MLHNNLRMNNANCNSFHSYSAEARAPLPVTNYNFGVAM